MKKLHKSLVGAMIGLACANGAMAAECNVVSNRDPLAGALKFIGGGIGLSAGVLVSPFAGPIGITAVSIGGAYLGVKVGAKIYAKDDYVCFDKDGKKCLQCDLHQIGDPYECNDGKVVVAPGVVKRCHTHIVGKDAWKDYKIPVCGGSKQLTGEKGSVEADIHSKLLKDLTTQGVPGAWVTEDDVCYVYKCAAGYEEKDGKCVKKGVTPPPPGPGQDGISEQECYDRGGIPMTNGTCRCRDGEWFSKEEGRCKSKSNCRNCIDGAGITFKLDNRGGVIVIGDNNSNISNGGNNNTNTNSNNNGSYNGGGGNSSSLQNCLNSRTTDNGKACCYLPKTGANGAQYDAATDKCNCNAAGKTFSVVNGRGQCTGGNVPDPNHNCPANMYYNPNVGHCMCSADNQRETDNNTKCECAVPDAKNDANGQCQCNVSGMIIKDGQCVFEAKQCQTPGMTFDDTTGKCKCANPYQREINNFTGCECTVPGAKNDANNVCQCTDKDKVVKDGKCEYGESGLANIRANISAAFSSLSSKMGGFEKSVWKDAEGNFNTARLASDSIAGVVLGTAGGIITSKLVKKSQLKKGFEDIKCSIGGQNVASYGDTFSVGM